MVSIVFCKYSVANIEIKLHFINICHDYFILFDTEMTFEMSVVYWKLVNILDLAMPHSRLVHTSHPSLQR